MREVRSFIRFVFSGKSKILLVVRSHHKVPDAVGASAVLAAARLQLNVNQVWRAIHRAGHQGGVGCRVI